MKRLLACLFLLVSITAAPAADSLVLAVFDATR